MPTGPATLALVFVYATEHYPLMPIRSFASAKADFENLRKAKAGPATPTYKPTIGASGTTASAGATAVGTSSAASAGFRPLYQQHQITRPVGYPFANLVLAPGVHRLYLQGVMEPNPLPVLSDLPALVDSSIPSCPTQSPWSTVLQPLSPHPTPNSAFSHAALNLSEIPKQRPPGQLRKHK